MGGPQGRLLMPQCCVFEESVALPDIAEGLMHDLDADLTRLVHGHIIAYPLLCCAALAGNSVGQA